jgi:hypothetical protein
MVYRMMSALFAVAALTAFLWAGYLYLRARAQERGLMVEEPDRVFNDLVPGREYEIEFRVHNRTSQTLRIVGGA